MLSTSSKLTSKYQTTIPAPIRKLLHLEAGDSIAFDVEDNHVSVRKAQAIDLVFAQSLEGTLNEWTSAADEEAYREL